MIQLRANRKRGFFPLPRLNEGQDAFAGMGDTVVVVHRPVRGERPRTAARSARRVAVRRGFSLLEVILALTILAGALAVLGEVARQGMESARIARDLTYAQCICDSLMAELASGLIYPEIVDQAPVDEIADPGQQGWVYSMDVESTEIDGLLAVRITVSQALPPEKRPVQCSLVRWIQDPDVTLSTVSTPTQ